MARKYLSIPPILAATAWAVTVLTLLILWLVNDRPKYEATSPDISFISNIGSYYYELFIIGAGATALFFAITLFIFIFYHRYTWKQNSNNNNSNTTTLPSNGGNLRKPRTWADFVSFVFGLIASATLVLLAVYDSARYDTLHWVFTLAFAFSSILCAVFNLVGISINRSLKRRKMSSFIMKIIFIVLSTIILAAMIVLMYSCESNNMSLTSSCNKIRSIAAILEWSLAGLFFVFILSWIVDFS